MPETDPSKRLGFGEFLSVSVWVAKTFFSLSPFWVSVNLFSNLFTSVRGLVYSFLFAKILDALIHIAQTPSPVLTDIVPYLVILFVYNQAENFIRMMQRQSETYFRQAGRTKLKLMYIDKLQWLGIQTLEDPEVANKMARSDENLSYVNQYIFSMVALIGTTFGLISAALVVLSNIPLILPILIVVAIPQVFVSRHYVHHIWKFDKDNTEERRRANWNAGELSEPKSLQEVLLSGAFKFLRSKYADFMFRYDQQSFQMRTRWRVIGFLLSIVQDLAIFGGYLMIFMRLLSKQISIGDTTLHMQSLQIFSGQLGAFTSWITDLQEQAVRINDVVSLLQMKPLFTDGRIKMEYPIAAPEITIQDMSFQYPRSEKFIFKKLNLQIKPGEKIAIVGHNGAGKTTLVKLISRLYVATEGQILINGVNLNGLRLEDWHKNIGVLFQDFNAYGQLSVKDNIFIGRPTGRADMDKIMAAAKNADADDFIDEFPLKYEQLLNEKFKKGTRPSGGMWQKIAIARFFYRNAPLVIFDEPTAAIDAVSEYKIFNRIYKFFKNKTVIIISHRFSTVRNADRIIVMDKGRIVEEGSHAELMAINGKYAEAFRLQAEGYQH